MQTIENKTTPTIEIQTYAKLFLKIANIIRNNDKLSPEVVFYEIIYPLIALKKITIKNNLSFLDTLNNFKNNTLIDTNEEPINKEIIYILNNFFYISKLKKDTLIDIEEEFNDIVYLNNIFLKQDILTKTLSYFETISGTQEQRILAKNLLDFGTTFQDYLLTLKKENRLDTLLNNNEKINIAFIGKNIVENFHKNESLYSTNTQQNNDIKLNYFSCSDSEWLFKDENIETQLKELKYTKVHNILNGFNESNEIKFSLLKDIYDSLDFIVIDSVNKNKESMNYLLKHLNPKTKIILIDFKENFLDATYKLLNIEYINFRRNRNEHFSNVLTFFNANKSLHTQKDNNNYNVHIKNSIKEIGNTNYESDSLIIPFYSFHNIFHTKNFVILKQVDLFEELKDFLNKKNKDGHIEYSLNELLAIKDIKPIVIKDEETYSRISISSNKERILDSISIRDTLIGKKISTKEQKLVSNKDLILSKINTFESYIGILNTNDIKQKNTKNKELQKEKLDNIIISKSFEVLKNIAPKILLNEYFVFLIKCNNSSLLRKIKNSSKMDRSGRYYLNLKSFLDIKIELPSIEEQKKVIKKIKDIDRKINDLKIEKLKYIN
jgi:hypothetical protein